jgi:hypothetical protein
VVARRHALENRLPLSRRLVRARSTPSALSSPADPQAPTTRNGNTEEVVHGCSDLLARSEVALGRLQRRMSEEHLDLLEPTAGLAA